MTTTAQPGAATVTRIAGKRLTRILVPLLLLYLVDFIDRNNISFAVIGGMNKDLHIGNADAGLASGIFFIGYCILQIPSGILAAKFDIRRFLLILGSAWGVVSVATGLAQNLGELLAARFALGLIEGCVWAAILVLLSRWFADRERATANSIWLLCLPLSFIVMSPLSGIIIDSLSWRWLFFIEGAPAIVFSIVVYFTTASSPAVAPWLSDAERAGILASQAGDAERPKVTGYGKAIFNRQVLLLSGVYFFWLLGTVGYSTWLPAVVKQATGAGLGFTGVISALPYVLAFIGLAIVGRLTDRTGQAKLIAVVDFALLGVFVLASILASSVPVLSLALLIFGGLFFFAMHAPFWTITMEILPAALVGAGIGMISLIGNVGSFLGPYLMGWIQQGTGSYNTGLAAMSVSLFIASALMLVARKKNTSAGAEQQ
ncbi:MAG TPA: MFS transporter [Trebonia sp.]|jgi:sugar phosphate permease